MDPLLQNGPSWNKFTIKDENFAVPDGITGHQLAIKNQGTQKTVLVIGGQRTFINAERKELERKILIKKQYGETPKSEFKKPSIIFGLILQENTLTATSVRMNVNQINDTST